MPTAPLDPEKIEAIRTLMAAGRDAEGRPWTGARIARALGISGQAVRAHRKRILQHAGAVASGRDRVRQGARQIRELIGLEE